MITSPIRLLCLEKRLVTFECLIRGFNIKSMAEKYHNKAQKYYPNNNIFLFAFSQVHSLKFSKSRYVGMDFKSNRVFFVYDGSWLDFSYIFNEGDTKKEKCRIFLFLFLKAVYVYFKYTSWII